MEKILLINYQNLVLISLKWRKTLSLLFYVIQMAKKILFIFKESLILVIWP